MTDLADFWSTWTREAQASTARLAAAERDLSEQFAALSRRTKRLADKATDEVEQRELRAPSFDFEAAVQRLQRSGPAGLSQRELKQLIKLPGYLDRRALRECFKLHPALVAHALRTCLVHWPRYVSETWGEEYQAALLQQGELPRAVLRAPTVSPSALLAREGVTGAKYVAGLLPAAELADASHYLRDTLGVRDAWLFASSVLGAWIHQRGLDAPGASQTDLVDILLDDARLRGLLPAAARSTQDTPSLRSDLATQAMVVATLLSYAFALPARIAPKSQSALVSYLLASTFHDPRDALRSAGWLEVARINPFGFQALLSSLCEQDLALFFTHAMNEPDRHKFWLRYLGSLERTACVLDKTVRHRLQVKLSSTPEAQSVLDRAFAFRNSSNVQAFVLFFPSIVVVEFSDTGNAAYIYEREFFAKEFEPLLRSGRIDTANSLKKSFHPERITHSGKWQAKAAERLAMEGIHARGRTREQAK